MFFTATSQLVYVLSTLRTDVNAIKEANKLFYTFLWNGKCDKIKRDVMINDYPNGSLKMIDIQSFSNSLKVTWIKKYLDTEQQKCHVTNIYTVEEKQKYHITLFCEKNRSIILHHVLPNTPGNVFLRPLLFS